MMVITKKEYQEYVKGDISTDKKQAIDQYLTDHPLERKSLEAAVNYEAGNSFEDLISQLENRVQERVEELIPQVDVITESQQQGRVFNLWPYLISVAAVAAAVVFLVLPNFTQTNIQTTDYFDAYPDVISATVRGENPPPKDDVLRALQAYNRSDYETTISLLSPVIADDPVDRRIPFYYAVSLVGAGKYGEALTILEELAEEPAFPYMDGVLWNLALCQIETNQKIAAKETLELVIKNNLYKKKEAQEVLSKL